MNENEKDEIIDDSEDEFEESIDNFVSDLEELTEDYDEPDDKDEDGEDENDESNEDDDDTIPAKKTRDDEEEEDEEPENDNTKTDDVKTDENDSEAESANSDAISEAEKKLKAFIKQGKRTLKNLGIEVEKDEDVLTELQRISAEAEGKTLENYQKEIADEENANDSWEDVYAKDLEAIQKEFPSAKKYKHLKELPNVGRFAELMNSGKVSAVEAFKISHPKEAEEQIVKSVKQSSLNDTKSHLKSTIPKKSGGKREISNSEMREYRDMFPDLSDKEIEKLCRRVSN